MVIYGDGPGHLLYIQYDNNTFPQFPTLKTMIF